MICFFVAGGDARRQFRDVMVILAYARIPLKDPWSIYYIIPGEDPSLFSRVGVDSGFPAVSPFYWNKSIY